MWPVEELLQVVCETVVNALRTLIFRTVAAGLNVYQIGDKVVLVLHSWLFHLPPR